jgi:DNA topoisomerase-1
VLEQLNHNGVLVPDPPVPPGLYIAVDGLRLDLDPSQEEMALAWAAKKDTPYVLDPEFIANFCRDFFQALGLKGPLTLERVDFTLYYELVDERRRLKEALTPEQRKMQAAERKGIAEELKARYGYAIVNGQRVELGTYMVEPSGIYMGRGQHPLRGRWKQGARQGDITLNYGPNTPDLGAGWKEIVWQPESMWVARWEDRLTGKLKYIWLSDTAPVNQGREAGKFDQALKLDDKLEQVRAAIQAGFQSGDARMRMIAAACYLIDTLCLRVGDEKEADEADTVGATTLRPEHVTLYEDGSAEFDFLGKDSVHWNKKLMLDPGAYDCLAELIAHARPSRTTAGGANVAASWPQIFPDISSANVNAFFSRILPGLSAKKFRTYHATKAVEASLATSKVKGRDPDYKKWLAANMANLEAAELCNHTKQVRGAWEDVQGRYEQHIAAADERVHAIRRQLDELRTQHADLQSEAETVESAADELKREAVRARYLKRLDSSRRKVEQVVERRKRAEDALGKAKAQMEVARGKREWNLSTSLKSYVDPRVYQRWGARVDYDVLNSFYPTALRRKYAWVQYIDQEEPEDALLVRPCLPGDLGPVAYLLRSVTGDDISVDALRDRFLPELGGDWREALIAVGPEEQVVAFAALGPVYVLEGVPEVDCYAAIGADHRTDEVADRLANELTRQYERFVLLHPVKRGQPSYRLAARDSAWYAWAPGLPERLGLSAPADPASSDTLSETEVDASIQSV